MSRAVAGEKGFMRTQDRFGREVLVAFRPVGYEDWGLVAKMDVDEAVCTSQPAASPVACNQRIDRDTELGCPLLSAHTEDGA